MLRSVPMDLSNVKRPENLVPGDRIKVWGEDLLVESAQPSLDSLGVSVALYPPAGGDAINVVYPPGVLVEVADKAAPTD